MAILYSLTAIVVVLLALVGLVLYVDARGEQKVRRAWERAMDARLVGHDKSIATLERAVALLVPPDARPTAPHRPAVGLSRPFRPHPRRCRATRSTCGSARSATPRARRAS